MFGLNTRSIVKALRVPQGESVPGEGDGDMKNQEYSFGSIDCEKPFGQLYNLARRQIGIQV